MLSSYDESNLVINFYVDNRASIHSLVKYKIDSILVKETIITLNKLAKNNTVIINWVKAHQGHVGNEVADNLAKQGSKRKISDKTSPPQNFFNTLIETKTYKKWETFWVNLDGHRQSKIFYKAPNKKLSKHLLKLNRTELSNIVRITTGFNNLLYQRVKTGQTTNSTCRICEIHDPEDAEHIVKECPKLMEWREDCLGSRFLEDDIWTADGMNKFLKHNSIRTLVNRDLYVVYY